ncbi:hypothetical protein J7I93_05600 [Bacillus sp. ISL-47]|uniref:DUF2268 domain-containing putative Zn-dependent protease n=1 Tax=Bacillus sp. ISL-47 TaxID=2819130 RepID=UPI001BE536FC|nr:DUF2268 domain-containing putative Zn-dependent protease [Bacillus sp. ISL-47]MBT2687656.1 hypothetical protein [Bacillus sp. ISL-47]MBT2710692.1 hypothetical protein [Pseudomonas sp. ISL-84]
MVYTLNQITPAKLIESRDNLKNWLQTQLSPLFSKTSWMQDWDQLAGRFQLLKFETLSEAEILSYSWNPKEISTTIHETITEVEKHLHFQNLSITIVPALPFPWFQQYDQSLWTNGYTIGADTIIMAIPPEPDREFFKYMLAHEMHHASPENPIYNLTLNTFSLADWYKMEGGAEYFSLSLYDDKRWWKENLTEEAEKAYQKIAQDNIDTTDDVLKSKICFGNREMDIPVFAGYCFAYKMVRKYAEQQKIRSYRELYKADPLDIFNDFIAN